MPYATAADLDAKWGTELVDLAAWDAGSNARDAARVDVALAAASAIVDAYLGRRYKLPLALADAGALALKNATCDLAMGQLSNTPGTRNDIVAEAEKRAFVFLRDVADGKAAIAVVAAEAPEIAPNEPIMVDDGRRFTRQRLRDL